jgi:SAM-dependent methyltransferase
MNHDPWLTRWLPLLASCVAHDDILEIGCGPGDDSATLVAAGFNVIAFDLSDQAVHAAQARVPEARFCCQDIREAFPVGLRPIGGVVASLSLHYFSWSETAGIVRRIHELLRPGGSLLCRLNSTADHSHGASGHPAIEENFYLVDGVPKRFFDEASVLRLFSEGWRCISMEHHVSQKYAQPKSLWEVILERDA